LLLLLQPGCCCRWLEATATAVARWLSTWQEAKVCNPGKQSRGRRELTVCAFGELREEKWSNKTDEMKLELGKQFNWFYTWTEDVNEMIHLFNFF
jgi:hypothetical protein